MKKFLLALAVSLSQYALRAQCGTNPTSGLITISTANQIVNSYYPGSGDPLAGQNSLTVGAIDGRGSATAIAAGDLVLIIQMQGADINATNTDSYGDGAAGNPASGALTANLYAGYYEYNTVSSVSATTINFTYTLANSYYTRTFGTGTGTRQYQVVRVPRYYNLTINAGASVTCPAWNGSTGGIAVLDAVNVMTVSGTVSVSGKGFRGGGGKNFGGAGSGNSNGASTLQNTDYRFESAVTNTSNTTGAAKGEGIAGTPIYVYANGTTTTVSGTLEGYVNGSMGRGAPGNAGGGGTDGVPLGSGNNQYNTGGGGGANRGSGGRGGSGWHGGTGDQTTYPYGGFGGAAFTAQALQRLIMGGGGGAGTANNSDGTNEYQSSGGTGGGILILRAKSYAGSGSLTADGAAAPGVNGTPTTNTDAAGGGGAGGTIVAVTRQSGAAGLNSMTASVAGGKGGDMANYYDHGPGGGGGGGIIYTNGSFSSTTVTGGANGKTRTGSSTGTLNNDFGATAGNAGAVVTLGFVPVLVNNNNVASPCGVLPVSLVAFSAVAKNGGNQVNWEIAAARNFNHFELEYSTDGSNFATAARKDFVNGTNNYEAFHTAGNAAMVYYRLKMVDDNGAFTYSNIITLRLSRDGRTVLLYPNPTADVMTLQLRSQSRAGAIISFIDAAGKVVLQQSAIVQEGDNSMQVKTAVLPPGLYLVQVQVKGETVAKEQVIKQ